MTNAEKFEKVFGFDINRLFAWDTEKYDAWADASISDEKTELAEEQALKKEIAEYAARERILEKSCQFKDGIIEGLKFAIRCNGVSGGEVRT